MLDLSNLSIREVTEADLPALEWDGEYTHFRNIYRRALIESKQGHRILLLAELKQAVIGQIFIHLHHDGFDLTKELNAYLYSFRVQDAYRNLGIGSLLLIHAEELLKEKGYLRTTISVAKENSDARRMYERHGYSICGEDRGEWSFLDHKGSLRNIREPAYILEKSLNPKNQST